MGSLGPPARWEPRRACRVRADGGIGLDARGALMALQPVPFDWKPMSSVGPGVREIRVRDPSGGYRVF